MNHNNTISIGNSTIFDKKLKSEVSSDNTANETNKVNVETPKVNSMKISQNGASFFINGFNRKK